MSVTWSAPVRYAETDQQGIVFNANYLLYCDEAMGAFCEQRGLLGIASDLRLVASSQTWSSGARWGEVVSITARCEHVGRTSLRMTFEAAASARPTCNVVTSYVYADAEGAPRPIASDVRAQLLAAAP